MLKLVIPKGSLEAQTLRLMEQADLRVRRGSDRDYHGTVDDERIERVSLLRPQEIPTYVEDGLFDLGITGRDWIAETGADVDSVVVGGRVVVRAGRVLTVDEERLRARAQAAADRVRDANADAWRLADQLSPHIAAACQAAVATPYPINRYAAPIG